MGGRELVRITVKPNTYLYLALLLICIPIRWLFAWFVAVVMHETGHWLAVKFCGADVTDLTIGLWGITMESGVLSNKKRLACILCGPVFGLLPALFGSWIPRIALCCWLLTIYNLVPIQPLDGGNALQIVVGNRRSYVIVERIILSLLAVGAVYLAFCSGFGFVPLLIVLLLWIRNRNTPCNTRAFKVQ